MYHNTLSFGGIFLGFTEDKNAIFIRVVIFCEVISKQQPPPKKIKKMK